eukprot:5634186-Amphidinium_carterae.1
MDHKKGRDEAKASLEAAISLREKEASEFSAEAAELEANIAALTKAAESNMHVLSSFVIVRYCLVT